MKLLQLFAAACAAGVLLVVGLLPTGAVRAEAGFSPGKQLLLVPISPTREDCRRMRQANHLVVKSLHDQKRACNDAMFESRSWYQRGELG